MVFGHITTTSVLVRTFERKRAVGFVYLAAVLGAYMPDYVDKGLMFIFGIGNLRGFGHTLVFLVPLSLVVWKLSKNWRSKTEVNQVAAKWFVAGFYLHLIEDLINPKVLLWPLLGEFPTRPPETLLDILRNVYVDRLNFPLFVFEMVGHLLFLCLFLPDLVRWIKSRSHGKVHLNAQKSTPLSMPTSANTINKTKEHSI